MDDPEIGAADGLLIYLFLFWLAIMAVSGVIWLIKKAILPEEKSDPRIAQRELAVLVKLPKQLVDDSLSMPSGDIYTSQRGIVARRKIEEAFRNDPVLKSLGRKDQGVT